MGSSSQFYFFIVCFFLVGFSPSCIDDHPATEEANEISTPAMLPQTQVLVLLDKTMSLNNDSLILKFEQPLRSRLVDLIQQKDDAVTVHYIHGNTGGAQAIYHGMITVAKPTAEELEQMGGASQEARLKEYDREISRQRAAISDKVKTALMAPNPERTKLHTDLWATLETVSRTFANVTADGKKYVIFVSDMEESMKGENRRDFTKQAPADKAEAETWADEDLEIIQQLYKIQPEKLANTQIAIYLPKEAQEASDFQTILYYWEAIFEKLNIPDPEVSGIEIGQ